MTSAEQAGRDLAGIALDAMVGKSHDGIEDLLARMFASTMRNAVEVEREVCATIADEEANHPDGDSASAAAERIRARGTR